MLVKIRAVRLRLTTEQHAAGARVVFKADGLSVIRADNSSGKTQLLQAIPFALGLEGMFGPSHQLPLGSALTTEAELHVDGDSAVEAVLTSWCAVELENEKGDVLVAQRFAKHPDVHPNLVRVWRAPVLSESLPTQNPEQFFVRERNAARNELGFHTELARFFGWSLPVVPRYTGDDAILYPEVIAPYLYVDQRAWTSTSPRQVTQFQLREPMRRTFEFMLGLKGPDMAAERARLENQIAARNTDWVALSRSASAISSVAGARVVGLPKTPAGATAHSSKAVTPTDVSAAAVEVLEGSEWVRMEELLERLQRDAQTTGDDSQVEKQPEATALLVGEERAELERRLAETERELRDLNVTSAMLERETTLLEAQVDALDRRVASLSEERSRHQDIKTLVRLGGDDHRHGLGDEDCPTCHQRLEAIEADDLGPILGIDDALGLLNAELATAEAMRSEAQRATDTTRAAFDALARRVDSVRVRIRSLREDLIAPSDYPSASDITERVAAELRVAELERVKDRLTEVLEQMSEVAVALATARSRLNDLPNTVPAEDETLIAAVQSSMQGQLSDFGFASYSNKNVGLDELTLKPARVGFDLDSDVSASDVVRIKIAYLNAMREVALAADSPGHPGFLILDEPRQHELEAENFRSTLSRLAAATRGQVIVTTAASRSSLPELLPSGSDDIVADVDAGTRVIAIEGDDDWMDIEPSTAPDAEV